MKIISSNRFRRAGAAIITTMVAMALLTVILSVVTMQVVRHHQQVRQRERQYQAEWLARAGVERAVARLLERGDAFTDDSSSLIPDAKLHIVVEKRKDNHFNVTVEAQVGLQDVMPVVRSTSRYFRRSEMDGSIRLEAVRVN